LYLTEENMIQLTNAFIRNLSMPNVTEDLCAQSVRNLAFLARCLAVNGAIWNWQKVDDDDEVEGATNGHQGATNGEAASDEEEWGGLSPPPQQARSKDTSGPPTAIHRLVTRLSGLIRRETKIMRLAALYPKVATMTLLETLSAKLPVDSLKSALPHLLTTLSTLVDPATTVPRSTDPNFNEQYKTIIDKAREVMSILHKQLGTQEYLAIMQEAITMPERHHKEKRRRHEVARARKKEKSAEERGRRRGW
jgi:U3 small nucleolar RNA-associated protein 20